MTSRVIHVYLFRAGDKHYKVGVTKDLIKRIKAIQTSNPNKVELVTSRLVELPFGVENELHQKLADLASGGGTEWFVLKPQQVIELCIFIQHYPHVELSERVIIKDLLDRQLMWKKTVEKKMDIILNNYQKAVVRTLSGKQEIEFDASKETATSISENDDQVTYERAKAVVLEENKASTSLLQRRLRIGYGRAARIIEQLEKEGIVGPADGSRPRRINVPETAESTV